MMMDTSRLVLRVVLERYDVARARRLPRGNAPSTSSLEEEEEARAGSEGGEVAAGAAEAKKGRKGEEKVSDAIDCGRSPDRGKGCDRTTDRRPWGL